MTPPTMPTGTGTEPAVNEQAVNEQAAVRAGRRGPVESLPLFGG